MGNIHKALIHKHVLQHIFLMDFAVTFQKGKKKKEKEKIPENKEGEKKDEGRENDEEKTKKGRKKMEEENYKKHFRYSTTTNSKVTVYLTTPITIKNLPLI